MQTIQSELLKWYQNNKRNLPWRESNDPYVVWLSEVILQQTRISQGLPYFQKFIAKYPGVIQLANAPLDEVLKLWQGLGYYSRARNMHDTAKSIVTKYNGHFPEDYDALVKLKGVGDYTASMIASVCFDKAEAVLDGNVFRVLSRLFNHHKPINAPGAKTEFKEFAKELLDDQQPGDFNQAMMELGALVCVPTKPGCGHCPLMHHCESFRKNNQETLPKKLPKRKSKKRFFHYLFISDGKDVLIRQRPENDIWKQLYEFPMIERAYGNPMVQKDLSGITGLKVQLREVSDTIKHKLTHQDLYICFYRLEVANDVFGALYENDSSIKKVRLNELGKYAVPKPIESYLVQNGLVNPKS